MENQFLIDSEYLSKEAVREETPPGNRPLLKKESYGIYGRNGTDQIRCHG